VEKRLHFYVFLQKADGQLRILLI